MKAIRLTVLALFICFCTGWQALAQPGSTIKTDSTSAGDNEPEAEKKAQKQTENDDAEAFLTQESDEKKPDGSLPICVDGQEILRIHQRFGPYSIESRASNINQRLEKAKSNPHYVDIIENIHAQNQKNVAEVIMGNEPLLLITDQDARLEGMSDRMALAERDASNLKASLLRSLEAHRPQNLLLAAGETALSALALILSLALLNWILPKLYRWVDSAKGKQIKSLRIQNAELVSVHTLADIFIGLLRVVRVGLVFTLLALFIPLALSFFPETRGLANDIVSWALQPVIAVALPAILAYLPNILVIVMIAVSTYYLVTFVHFLFSEIGRGTITISNFDPEWADPTYKIIRFLVIAFAFVLIFPYLPGSGSPAFQQVSIFLGVLFSLGSSGAISHLVAGVFLTYTGAFKLGDRVKIADAVGDVVEKTLLATRIRTIKHEYITIPNALVLSSHIINYSSSAANPGLVLHTSVTIGYDAPWRDVQATLIRAAQKTANILTEPEPFILQTSLDDFFVTYELNAFTNQPQMMAVTYSELHKNIQDEFNEAGIEIMSPHYATLRDGNRTTIPEKYLGENYTEPGFNVKMK